MSRKARWGIINTVVPIIIGGALYYFFFPKVLFVEWIDSLLKTGIHFDTENSSLLVAVLRNQILDAIWSYSFCNLLYLIIREGKREVLCFIFPTLLGTTMEILQKVGVVTGTFDYWDIVAEGAGSALAYILIKMYGGKNEKI